MMAKKMILRVFSLLVLFAAAAGAPSSRRGGGELYRPCFDSRELAAQAGSEEVVLVTASYDYRGILMNWLVAMDAVDDVGTVTVLCLDEGLRSFLRSVALDCVPCYARGPAPPRGRNGHIWYSRVKALAEVLALEGGGKNVTLSDVDAVWLRSPRPYWGLGDIVASRGSFPSWAAKEWGASLCMGLVRFAQSAASFVEDRLLPDFHGDDQIALNTALKNAGLKWRGGGGGDELLEYVDSTEVDVGDTANIEPGGPLKVALLPHDKFVRICDRPEDATGGVVVVKHCYTAKNVASKESSLAQRRLWFLADDWQDRIPRAPPLASDKDPRRTHFSSVVVPRIRRDQHGA